jgi:acid phosphatase family membrane protein YuiD
MTVSDSIDLLVGVLQGVGASTVFILALFIGFCVLFGFTKLKQTAGGRATVIKSLDERVSRRPMVYLTPSDPRGPADQLRSPELLERA